MRNAKRIHDRDRALRARMLDWADKFLDIGPPDELSPDEPLADFTITLMLFHVDFQGATVAQRFLESRGPVRDDNERAWLNAQMTAWLSVWEVEDVDPGSSMELRDLLTGETRTVRERKASLSCPLRTNILARVVDFEGGSYLCGTHPVPLPPMMADKALQIIRKRLRVRKPVTQARLRSSRTVLMVSDVWDDVIEALIQAFEDGPELVNAEGDPVLGVIDRYSVKDGMAAAVADRIFHMDGVQKISDVLAILVRDRSILANIDIERGRLRVEAHSVKRADSARSALELACGDGIRFHSREIVDPTSRKVQEEVAARPRQPRSADELALTRAYKDRYYASWIDEPVPLLDDLTPRQAMETVDGSRRLELLLRDMEYREQGLDPRERFDIASLRKQLGLVED